MRCFSGQPLSKINTAPKDKAITLNPRTFSDPGLPATISPRHPYVPLVLIPEPLLHYETRGQTRFFF